MRNRGIRRGAQAYQNVGQVAAEIRRKVEEDEVESESDLSPDDGDYDSGGSGNEEQSVQAKRFRLAKDLIGRIEAQVAEGAAQTSETLKVGPQNDRFDNRNVVAEKLKEQAMETFGNLRCKVAGTVSFRDSFMKFKAIRLSLTCVALTKDARYAVTGSKDGTVVKYDLELQKRVGVLKYDGKAGNQHHKGSVMAVVISDNLKFCVTGGVDGLLKVWDFSSLSFMRDLKGHRKTITGLAFRRNSTQLFSSSTDRTVKAWELDAMGYADTMFGHQDAVLDVDCLSKERSVSCGSQDRSARLWKVADESQLVFNGLQNSGSIDCVRLINDDHFVSGGMDGSLCIWSLCRKKPVCSRKLAHGCQGTEANWIISLATHRYTDLVFSGSNDGYVRMWKVGDDYKSLEQCSQIPLKGFINAMAVSIDGNKLACSVGQEHKCGRWWKDKAAKNALVIISLDYKE